MYCRWSECKFPGKGELIPSSLSNNLKFRTGILFLFCVTIQPLWQNWIKACLRGLASANVGAKSILSGRVFNPISARYDPWPLYKFIKKTPGAFDAKHQAPWRCLVFGCSKVPGVLHSLPGVWKEFAGEHFLHVTPTAFWCIFSRNLLQTYHAYGVGDFGVGYGWCSLVLKETEPRSGEMCVGYRAIPISRTA